MRYNWCMRFRQIEVFHAVYTTGSISAAARALHVSQPSVSKVLHHMQAQLGLELFTLVRGRLVPTDEAHALFTEVADLFGRLRSLQKTVRNIRSADEAHIRLAVVPSLGLHAAPTAIKRFRDRHPGVTFEVQTLHHDDVFEALYERSCDIAVAYSPPAHPRLRRRPLARADMVLLFRSDALAEPGKAVALDWLDGREMVGLTAGGPLGELFANALQQAGSQVREVVSNQTFYIAAALTRAGAGMSVVDEFTARATAGNGVEYRPFTPPIRFPVECVYLEDRPPSAAAERFIATFKAVLEDTGARRVATGHP